MFQASIVNLALGIFSGLRLNVWALLPIAIAEAAVSILVGPRLLALSVENVVVAIASLQIGYVVAAFSTSVVREKRADLSACRPGYVPAKY